MVAERIEKFEYLLTLESAVRITDALALMGADNATRERARETAERMRAVLYGAVDQLTTEEATAYGVYRLVKA